VSPRSSTPSVARGKATSETPTAASRSIGVSALAISVSVLKTEVGSSAIKFETMDGSAIESAAIESAAIEPAGFESATMDGAAIRSAAIETAGSESSATGAIGSSRPEPSTSANSVGAAAFDSSDSGGPTSAPSAKHTPAPNTEMAIANARQLGDGRLVRIAPAPPSKSGAIPTIARVRFARPIISFRRPEMHGIYCMPERVQWWSSNECRCRATPPGGSRFPEALRFDAKSPRLLFFMDFQVGA